MHLQGAVDARAGVFEMAHKGTIFLDEIGELPPELQSKLLRVLEQREVRRIGASHAKPVDVRVVAATNRKLRDEISAGRFREDLYYRLAVVEVELPSLRDRLPTYRASSNISCPAPITTRESTDRSAGVPSSTGLSLARQRS